MSNILIVNVIPNLILDDTRDVCHDISVGTNIRQPKVENFPVTQRFYGPHNNERTRISTVKFIEECCGSDLPKYHDDLKQRYSLEPILEKTKREIAPLVSTRQLR